MLRLGLALLLAANAAAAADPLASVVEELKAKSRAYASGEVMLDPGLDGRLRELERLLGRYADALPPGDARRDAAGSLLRRAESARLRAAAAPPAAVRRSPETGADSARFWTALGASLAELAADAEALRTASAAADPSVASLMARAPEKEAVALAAQRGAEAAERARSLASGFGALSEPPAVPAVPLARGDRGPSVGGAQAGLNVLRRAAGAPVIAEHDAYGRITAAAVAKFQRGRPGLSPTGRLDPATEEALRREVEASRERSARFTQFGDESLGVEALQRRLNAAAGFRFLDPDGRYGDRTRDAVRAFQRDHGLPPTGSMDEATWNALIAAEPASEPRRSAAAPGSPMPLPPAGTTWPSKRIPAPLAALVRRAADEHGLDPAYFQALVWAEGGRLGDRSSSIARGPAQITRAAAVAECPDLGWAAVSTQDAANLECGARILARRPRQWLGEGADPLLAASLYNTKMKHWKTIAAKRKVPNFPETVSYVTRISRYYCQITGRRLLDPARHFDPKMNRLSRRVDREMSDEIADEGQTLRPGCSPAYPEPAAARAVAKR